MQIEKHFRFFNMRTGCTLNTKGPGEAGVPFFFLQTLQLMGQAPS